MNKTIKIVSKKIDVILRKDLIPFLKNKNFNSYKYSLSEPIYDNKELFLNVKYSTVRLKPYYFITINRRSLYTPVYL